MTTSEPGGTATPKPAPRPGPPRPGPRPGPAPTALHAAPVPAAGDPHRYGRVDPDGTVWLISSAGERVIGSWQAGDTEAAFAHFGRRFDDLSTEVALMESRLASGTGDARKIKSAATSLTESLPTAAVLGDVDALAARLTTILEHADTAAATEKAKREEHRAAQTARKETLAAEAEELAANSTQWKTAGDRLREILEEWRTISGLDRKTDDVLWKRYSAARETFNRRRGSHFAELDRERAAPVEARRRCANAPRHWPTPPTGARRSAFRDLLTSGRQRAVPEGRRRRAVAAVQGAQDTSSRPATPCPPSATRVPRERRGEGGVAGGGRELTPRTRRARARCARSATSGTGSARCPRARRRAGAAAARSEKKVQDAPSHGVDPEARARADQFRERAEQYERQAEKATAAGRTKDADEARANAEQWRQWAEAAADALGKRG